MNKAILGTVIGAIIIIVIIGIVFSQFENEKFENDIENEKFENDIENEKFENDIENEKLNEPISIPEKPTITKNENSENFQNAQMIVNLVIEKYDQNNQEITSLKNYLGFNIDVTNKKYVFVYDMETKNMWAHPNSDLLGKNVFEDLITTNEPVSHINSELIREGESIITYNWINPETLKEQIKTSYLKLHDGLVFGSGYFEN